MALGIPVVWSDDCMLHEPDGEVWVGVRTPGTELPARAQAIRAALDTAGAAFVDAEPHPDDAVLAVHSADLLRYLQTAWEDWQTSGLPTDPGQNRVVPYLFAHPGLLGDLPLRNPAATAARAGRFAFDTMTLIGPGTWEAARAAADAALTAADLVLDGAPAAYALCRPPGHHATRTAFGGSCYLNNVAIAAAHLRAATGERIAIVDIDAHHGNGAQSIFDEDPEVLTASVHVDPAAGWFPHFLGFADETGVGAGEGANRNVALAPGTGDEAWIGAIAGARDWAVSNGVRSLVIALGVDAAGGDPEAPLDVSADAFREAGSALGAPGLPAVVVQEGGYDLEAIGGLVAAFLAGLEGSTPNGGASS